MGRKMSKREFIERYMADVARLYIVKRGKGGRCEFTKKQLEDICGAGGVAKRLYL